MSSLFYKIIILFFFIISISKPAIADCWNIRLSDDSVLNTTAIWHIRNKLIDTPQAYLLGKKDGQDSQVAASKIDSITLTSKDAGWLQEDIFQAKLTLRDGQHLALIMQQALRYQKDSKNSANLPLKNIKQITHCISKAPLVSSLQSENKTIASISNPPLTIQLKNGDIIHGKIVADIQWQSAYGKLTIKAEKIDLLNYDAAKSSGMVTLKSGDHIIGTPSINKLSVHLSIGTTIEIPLRDIQNIISVGSRSK